MGKKVWNRPVISVVSVKSLTRGVDGVGGDACSKVIEFVDSCS